MSYNGSEEYSPTGRWTLSTGRERRLNDLALQQAEEQRLALAEQGRHRADTIKSTYDGISNAIDKGVSGYRSGQEAGRAERRDTREGESHVREGEAHGANMKLVGEQTKNAEFGNEETKAEMGLKNTVRPDGKTNRQYSYDLGIQGAEEGVKGAAAQRNFTVANTANLGREKIVADETKARADLETVLGQIPGAQERVTQLEATGQDATTARAQLAQLQSSVPSLAAKAKVDPGLLAAGTQKAGTAYTTGKQSAAVAQNLIDTSRTGHPAAVAKVDELTTKVGKLLKAASEYNNYDSIGGALGFDKSADAKRNFIGLVPESQQYIESDVFNKDRMKESLIKARGDVATELSMLKATSNAQGHTTIQPSVIALEAQLRQLDKAISGQSGGAVNAPFPGVKQGGPINVNLPPGTPKSMRP